MKFRTRALFLRHLCTRAVAVLAIGVGMAFFGSQVAQARNEVLRWTHANPQSVQRFEALVGVAPGVHLFVLNMAKPSADGQGIMSAAIDVDDAADAYIVVRAVGPTGVASFDSNEILRAGPPAPPAPPPPPPAPDPGPGGGGGPAPTPGAVPAGTPLVPNPNAVKRFTFANGLLTDWTHTGANNSLIEDSSLFAIADVAGDLGLTTESSAVNVHSHFTGSSNVWSNIVLRGRLAATNSGSIGVTAYSQYPASDTYYRLRSLSGGDTFKISSHPEDRLTCADDDTGVPLEAGVWYEFELKVESQSNQNRIQASIWRQGNPKPASYQAECVDSSASRPISGTIGVWAMGSGSKYWDDLEIIGISAPPVVPPTLPAPPILIDVVPVP